jgi:pimeloyl-ACP methyl ester carboxylesterase
MPTAAINGTEIYYETYGSGFPLVFVHGGYGGLGTGAAPSNPGWLDQFTDDFEVILYDRRSSGRSGFPEAPHTMEQFATDIAELLKHLGHERAHVWGTSAGGPITIQFGLSYPEMAASLVVTDTAPWLTQDEEIKARLKERIAILEADGVDAAYAARRESGTVGLQLFAASRPAADEAEARQREERAAAIRAQLGAIPREERIAKYAGELRTYGAYVDWDATDTFGTLAMPVLVFYGTGDTVFPNVDWASLAARGDQITYREFAGAEHGAAGSGPEALDEIRDFTRRHTPALAG